MKHIWRKLTIALANRMRGRRSVAQAVGNGHLTTLPMVAPKSIIHDMDDALANGEIYLAYQPKLCLRSGDIASVEALLRWQHKLVGFIPPDQLVAQAERCGRIRDLTFWVIARALADHAHLHEQGFRLTIYVNVSSQLLADSVFCKEILQLAPRLCGAIGFEITETSFIDDHDVTMSNLRLFASLGLTISIDDYGTGLSSLTYLKEFPASELKIDRVFVSDLTSCHRNPLIVRSTIDLAHALGMTVVAEGVDSLATVALLRAMGCDLIQGFILTKALPIVALKRYLKSGHHTHLLGLATGTIDAPWTFWSREQSVVQTVPATAVTK